VLCGTTNYKRNFNCLHPTYKYESVLRVPSLQYDSTSENPLPASCYLLRHIIRAHETCTLAPF